MTLEQAQEIVSKIKYRYWDIVIKDAEAAFIIKVIYTNAPDRDSGSPFDLVQISMITKTDLTEKKLIQAVFDTVVELEFHEVRESFYYNKQRLFDPHKKSNQLITRKLQQQLDKKVS